MQCIWLKITIIIIQIQLLSCYILQLLFRFKNEFKQSVKLYDINLCSLEFEQLWSKWKTKKVQQRRNNRLTINNNEKDFAGGHTSLLFSYPPLVKDISHQCLTARLIMLYDVAGRELGYGVSAMSRVSHWWTCSHLCREPVVNLQCAGLWEHVRVSGQR